jgi:hypothetical protein
VTTLVETDQVDDIGVLEAARIEIQRLRYERAWQPIEMAPTDKRVLVCVAEIPKHRRVIALKSKQGLWLDEQLQPMAYPPSHWQPLPAPPASESNRPAEPTGAENGSGW